jgi:hypothetical protein
MLICVETEASRESGAGETVTREPASAAETFKRGGTQLGEMRGSVNLLARALSAPALPERPTIAPIAEADSASTTTAGARRRRAPRPLTP